MQKIELLELTGNGEVHNLSGHERGVAARAKFNLAALDEGSEPVVVAIPEFVYTITPSFFQGMFADSVKKLGNREGFLAHYSFIAPPIVLQQIENGIRSSLMKRGNLFSH
ncbi:hypothetical protein EHS39_08970 [Ensifer sp. MPMI2T]|nr:hypothetical protein EHS39_08970 [Ensifer sp. MPMI2T]